jgi:DNA-binding LytR/AlgR family response regulator
MARLPVTWGGELIALEMEDHYVRAHSPEASTLILMRLRDAEAELTGLEGLRVHRSWWVSRAAVEQIIRNGRSLRLRLKGGLEAPVARDRVQALRVAGWIN